MASILDAVGALSLYTAAETGQMTGCGLRRICSQIMRGEAGEERHPFYGQAKSYIDAHPLPYREYYTKLDIYYLALCEDFQAEAMRSFFHDQHWMLRQIDMPHIEEIYRQMEELLGGGEQLERLGSLLRQRFLGVTVMAAYLQGLTEDMLSCLIRRDIESSRQVFQLWLDRVE